MSVEVCGPDEWPVIRKHGLTCAIASNGMPGAPFMKGLNNPAYQEQVIAVTSKMIDDCAAAGVPNVIAFTNAMEAWINSRHPDSLERVEAILDHMMDRSKNGDHESEPTTTTMNVVMKAIRYSSLPAKYKKAEELLNRMKWLDKNGIGRSRPNVATYNAVSKFLAI